MMDSPIRLAWGANGLVFGPNGGLMTSDCYRELCCEDPPHGCLPCCSRISEAAGRQEFNEDGDLVVDTGAIIWTITMPTKNSRVICDGDEIRVDAQIKEGLYDPLADYYEWASYHDRAWLLTNRGREYNGGVDSFGQVSYFYWRTEDPEAFAEYEHNHCFADWSVEYGRIEFYSITLNETLALVLENCEGTDEPSVDCCECTFECEPCCYYIPCGGQEVPPLLRPETINGKIVYYVPGDDGWEMRVEIDLDPDERRICRDSEDGPTELPIRLELLPPEGFEDQHFIERPRFCIYHPGWKGTDDAMGMRLVDDACYPNAFTLGNQCSEYSRQPDDDTSLTQTTTLTLISCDDDCTFVEPEDLIITATLDTGVANVYNEMQLTVVIETCPNPTGIECCEDEFPCCSDINITTTGTLIEDNPAGEGFLASGTINGYIYQVECNPNPDSDDGFIVSWFAAGTQAFVEDKTGPAPGTITFTDFDGQGWDASFECVQN